MNLNDLMQKDIGRTALSMIMWVLFAGLYSTAAAFLFKRSGPRSLIGLWLCVGGAFALMLILSGRSAGAFTLNAGIVSAILAMAITGGSSLRIYRAGPDTSVLPLTVRGFVGFFTGFLIPMLLLLVLHFQSF